MSAKPLPSAAEADELSAPAKVVELSVDELSDEDVVAAALPSSVRMMADFHRRLDRFAHPIAAIERMTAFVNKFDAVNKFDSVNMFGPVNMFDSVSRLHPQLGAMDHAADLAHQATVAAEMIAGHQHAMDLAHQATVAAEMIAGHQHAVDLARQMTAATEMTAGHQHAVDLARQMTAATEMIAGHKYAIDIFSELRAATEVFQAHKEMMAATTPWREMMDLARTYGVGDTVLNQFSRMSELDHGLARFLPSDMSERWSAHLKFAASPALSFLAHDWPEPVGLLAEVSEARLGASVSWLFRGNEEAVPMTAAIVPDNGSDEGTMVLVEVDPVCALCGGPLHSLGSETLWVGPKRGIRRQRLFPACSNCFPLEEEKPGTLLRMLTDLTRPSLRVIDGGRRGKGTPRGLLRLVRSDKP